MQWKQQCRLGANKCPRVSLTTIAEWHNGKTIAKRWPMFANRWIPILTEHDFWALVVSNNLRANRRTNWTHGICHGFFHALASFDRLAGHAMRWHGHWPTSHRIHWPAFDRRWHRNNAASQCEPLNREPMRFDRHRCEPKTTKRGGGRGSRLARNLPWSLIKKPLVNLIMPLSHTSCQQYDSERPGIDKQIQVW